MVPAYTFTKFGDLPLELQARIWSLAARFDMPRTRCLVLIGRQTRIHCSSLIEGTQIPEPFPEVVGICHLSREEAMKVYTRLKTTGASQQSAVDPYINTLYNSFYMGEQSWDKFKIVGVRREISSSVLTCFMMIS